ncbi:hypothetical protein [Glutamicibacter sp.]|uniref:hypothetical protein n=1 Tax=Glutamicibacter sp. TaxID=1931995 RepID=UPI0028BD9BB3|nr:hypothetical protein [Glutamicibacter sp.]
MPKKIAALALVSVLALASCSAASNEMPQDSTHQKAASAEPSAPAETEPMSTEEVATTAGAVMAAKLGFPNSAKITGDDLKSLAKKPEDTLKDIVVLPDTCAAPVQDLNWSPVQLGTDSARTDFTNEAQNITGSIEVAKLEDDADRDAVGAHNKNVAAILDGCKSVKINGLDYSEDLKFSDPKVDGVESALYYTRNGQYPQDSLVLIASTDDHAAMVSFVSAEPINDAKFNEVATSILDAALTQVK